MPAVVDAFVAAGAIGCAPVFIMASFAGLFNTFKPSKPTRKPSLYFSRKKPDFVSAEGCME
jgi:hypothetical protein